MDGVSQDRPGRETAEERIDWIARVRALGPAISAAAEEVERLRELPRPLVTTLAEAGLFRLLQPSDMGGGEVTPMDFAEIMGAVAFHDASTAWCVGQGNGCGAAAAYLAPEVAREIFGPDDGIVAWGPPSGAAKVTRVPGGYRLTGSWSFASGSHNASWFGAHIFEPGLDGKPIRRADGGTILRTLLFPKSRAHMTDIWRVMGLRGTGSDAYSVDDLFVAEDHTVLHDRRIPARAPGRLYRFSFSNLYASGFAGLALGVARAFYDSFVALAADKTPRGARTTMRHNNVVQSQVAQASARLRAARAFLLTALTEIWDEVGETGEVTLDHNATIRLASTWAIKQAREVVGELYHAAGATAIFDAQPFERRFRDINTIAQQMQGAQRHFETVGGILLGLEPDATMFTF
ncbi:MAG TPA: acyl-CoA dehydrogenase family protein [Stellaceae bacterium]|nr:acyl-CoA dehydrogenase family protein [Stellaceae bacterium]